MRRWEKKKTRGRKMTHLKKKYDKDYDKEKPDSALSV
jgi:hypothetical protein